MSLAVGARLGPYEVLGLLGAGGMGEVYRARDTRLGRRVAVKVLPSSLADDPDRLQRFDQEARAAGSLNHPGVLAIYDVGLQDRIPYVVYELLEGETLRDRLSGGRLPLRKVLDCATQVARGLAAAHARGIVHRDLKPENLFITSDGRVKILDFGLAKFTGTLGPEDETGTMKPRSDQTEPGAVVGTLAYMSPEQAKGQRVDHRSDLFSFGAILYEMLSGRRAFPGGSAAETMAAILREEPPAIDAAGNVPAALERIVRRCLEKNVEERFQSAHDLAFALEALSPAISLTGAQAAAEPAATALPRRGLPLIATALLAVALALGVALLGALRQPAGVDLARYRFTPLATEAGYEGAPSWAPDGRTLAYLGEVAGTLQVFTRSLASSMGAQITRSPRDCKDPFWSTDGTRLYYISLAGNAEGLWSVGAAGGTPKLVVRDTNAAALSPDGGTLYLLREEKYQGNFLQALWTCSPPGAEPRRVDWAQLAAKRFARGFLRASPDGKKLALWGASTSDEASHERGYANPELWIVTLPGGAARQSLRSIPRLPDPSPFSWMPDSRRILFSAAFTGGSPGTHLWLADTQTDALRPVTADSGSEQYPAVSPDGTRVAFTVQDEDYDLVELPTDGSPLRPLLETSRTEADPVWSPVAGQYAYVTDRAGDPEIWLRSRDGSLERPLVTRSSFPDDQTFLLGGLAFSPDGQRIAYQRRGPSGFRVWLSAIAGGPAVQLVSDDSYQDAPTWSPDGTWIAFTTLRQGQWSLARSRVGGGEPPVAITEGIVYPSNPKWSPKGDWITCDTLEGFFLVSPDGQRRRLLTEETWLAHAWSRDGSRIYAVRHSDQLRLQLVTLDVATGKETIVARDLGPSPPSDDPLKGLSLAADGRSLLTSILRLRGDVWLLEGFEREGGLLSRLWPRRGDQARP